MSATIATAARRRSRICLLTSTFLVRVLCLSISAARAQQTASADQPPPIEVTPPGDQNRPRAKPLPDEGSGSRRAVPAPGTSVAAPNNTPSGTTTTNRQFAGIVG